MNKYLVPLVLVMVSSISQLLPQPTIPLLKQTAEQYVDWTLIPEDDTDSLKTCFYNLTTMILEHAQSEKVISTLRIALRSIDTKKMPASVQRSFLQYLSENFDENTYQQLSRVESQFSQITDK